MATERFELPDGQWADIRISPKHRQNLAILAAGERATSERITYSEWASVIGRQLTESWFVRDEDGTLLDLDDEGWGDADPVVIDAICTRAQELWRDWQRGERRPKATSGNSSADTSPEPKSE